MQPKFLSNYSEDFLFLKKRTNMKYDVSTIEEYLDAIPHERREIVVKLISLLQEYFPEIEGNMQYNMPTFEPVCAIASQKHHISFYIHRVDLVEKYRDELGKLKVGKSCIRFNKMEKLPETTLRKILNEIKSKK